MSKIAIQKKVRVLDLSKLFFKKNYKNKSKMKIMSKLVHPSQVGKHISNAAITDIVIFFKLMSQSLTVAL